MSLETPKGTRTFRVAVYCAYNAYGLIGSERNGIAVDISVLRDLSQAMSGDIVRAEREIYDLVGHEFNIGSPQQLSDVLFKDLGLPKTRKMTQGYSTDQR